jgi:predicted NAD/FAD-dependent oxidoreductase
MSEGEGRAMHVAIVGAGMAGLAAARRLRTHAVGCTLFDKSRGVGGRMATRRAEALHFDHGAQYFTARGARFAALVARWQADGRAAPWFPDAFVGVPGMTAPARAMLADTALVAGCQVSALGRDAAGWTVATAAGPVDTPGNGSFDAVLLAVPSPQAVPLAASAGVALPGLARPRYAPCWALMLGFDAPCGLVGDHLRPAAGPIAWIARNGTKPGRPADHEAVVIHATPAWSQANLELTPEAAAAALGAAFAAETGVTATPSFAAAHRWRYALVETPLGQPCLWDAAARLGACGDWCLGPRVEAAFDSGEALAETVAAALGRG